jgi:hypothetical protein
MFYFEDERRCARASRCFSPQCVQSFSSCLRRGKDAEIAGRVAGLNLAVPANAEQVTRALKAKGVEITDNGVMLTRKRISGPASRRRSNPNPLAAVLRFQLGRRQVGRIAGAANWRS